MATGDEPARLLSLRVYETASELIAVLEVSEPAGGSLRRELRGTRCEAIVSAMAIVAALALEPDAQGAPVALPPGPVSAPPPPPPPPTPPLMPEPVVVTPPMAPPVVVVPEVVPTVPRPSRPTPTTDRDRAPREVERPSRLRLGVGVAAEVATLSAPSAVVAPEAHVELTFDSPRLLAPSFQLGFTRAEGGTVTEATHNVGFTWLLARAEACPIAIHLAASVALRPCAGLDVGSLSASVTNAPGPTSPSRAWVDARLEGQLAWRVAPWLSLDLAAGALISVTRDTFAFVPTATETAYVAPSSAFTASLGATVLFL